MAEPRLVTLPVPRGFQLPSMVDLGLGAPAPPTTLHIVDDQVDTEDLALARWGALLTHRTGVGWLISIPEGRAWPLDTTRVHVVDGERDIIPERVLAITAPFHRGRALDRRVRLGLSETSHQFGPDLSVVVTRFRVQRGHAEERFERVTVSETGDTGVGLLTPVVDRLRLAGAGAPVNEHRVSLAFGEPSTTFPGVAGVDRVASGIPAAAYESTTDLKPEIEIPAISAVATGSELVTAALASSTNQLLVRLPEVLAGGDETAIHDVRSIVRRMRSECITFGPLERRSTAILPEVDAELRRIGRRLGLVRDLDVLRSGLTDHLPDVSPGQQSVVHALTEIATLARHQHLEVAREHLGDSATKATLDRLVRLCQPTDSEPSLAFRKRAAQPAASLAPNLLGPLWRVLFRDDRHPDRLTDAEYHPLRLDVKVVNHALGALAPVLGSPALRLARRLGDIADTLGEARDAALRAHWLEARVADLDPTEAFVAGQLHVVAIDLSLDAEDAFRGQWRSLAESDDRAWIEGLVAS